MKTSFGDSIANFIGRLRRYYQISGNGIMAAECWYAYKEIYNTLF
jgi:hypothetical protein